MLSSDTDNLTELLDCKICYEKVARRKYYNCTKCKCIGTISSVHDSCLFDYINSLDIEDEKRTKCFLCKEPYLFSRYLNIKFYLKREQNYYFTMFRNYEQNNYRIGNFYSPNDIKKYMAIGLIISLLINFLLYYILPLSIFITLSLLLVKYTINFLIFFTRDINVMYLGRTFFRIKFLYLILVFHPMLDAQYVPLIYNIAEFLILLFDFVVFYLVSLLF